MQLLIYKIFVRTRRYNIDRALFKQPLLGVSSRGIIQTQFVEGLYNEIPENILVIVNESSNKPLRNFRLAQKTFKSFFFAEGYLKLTDLFREYFFVLAQYFSGRRLPVNFWGVKVDVYKLMPEVNVKFFHVKTYAHSFKRAIKSLEKKGWS